jgi:hypothetical protein
MKHFRRLWRGELALQDAFWMWAVLGGFLVNLFTSASFLFLIMADRPLLALLIGYGLSLPYNLMATIGVWRSAGHYDGDRQMADMAKAVTIVWMLALSFT